MLESHSSISMGNGMSKEALLLGVSPRYKDVRNLAVVAGRFFDDQDAINHEKVCVLIAPFARALFGSEADAIGKSFSIHGIPFTVVGVAKLRISDFGQSELSDQTALIPYPVARYLHRQRCGKGNLFTIANPLDVIHDSTRHYGDHPGPPTSQPVSFTRKTLVDVLDAADKIARALTYVLSIAAFITWWLAAWAL